jgi:predicted acylesterase/phospholipase RssA
MEDYDTLVLSGGGAKGFYLLGAIQSAMDIGLLANVKTYMGTSIGGIISYLLIIGYTPVEILVSIHTNNWFEKIQFLNIVSLVNCNGATSFAPLQEALEKMTIDKIGRYMTLGKLRDEYGKSLICTTYNMTKCQTEYLGPDNYPDMPCLTALRMSANIPLVFDRFKYMDCFYLDGGLTDNFPIIKADSLGGKVFGINLNVKEDTMKDIPEEGILSYVLKLNMIPRIHSIKSEVSRASERCKVINLVTDDLLSPVEFNVNSKTRLEMFSKGYNAVKEDFQLKNKV